MIIHSDIESTQNAIQDNHRQQTTLNYMALGLKYDMIKTNLDVFPKEKPTKLPPL